MVAEGFFFFPGSSRDRGGSRFMVALMAPTRVYQWISHSLSFCMAFSWSPLPAHVSAISILMAIGLSKSVKVYSATTLNSVDVISSTPQHHRKVIHKWAIHAWHPVQALNEQRTVSSEINFSQLLLNIWISQLLDTIRAGSPSLKSTDTRSHAELNPTGPLQAATPSPVLKLSFSVATSIFPWSEDSYW